MTHLRLSSDRFVSADLAKSACQQGQSEFVTSNDNMDLWNGKKHLKWSLIVRGEVCDGMFQQIQSHHF